MIKILSLNSCLHGLIFLVARSLCFGICLGILFLTGPHVEQALGLPLQDKDRPIIENKLGVEPVIQRTPEWCWLAVGEMIFTYFDLDELPSGYQCSTIGMFAGPRSACWANCMSCPLPSGTLQNFEKMVKDYPKAVASYQNQPLPRSLQISSRVQPLDWDDVKDEIDNKRPVAAGISPAAAPLSRPPQHMVLIVGYKESNGQQLLYVNDPFPYEQFALKVYTNVSLGGALSRRGNI